MRDATVQTHTHKRSKVLYLYFNIQYIVQLLTLVGSETSDITHIDVGIQCDLLSNDLVLEDPMASSKVDDLSVSENTLSIDEGEEMKCKNSTR